MNLPRQVLDGLILTPAGFVDGALHIGPEGLIASIEGTPVDSGALVTRPGRRILPGFIDLHVHGGGGCDVMDGGESALTVSATHAGHGTTALLATTMTAPPEDLSRAFQGLAASQAGAPRGGARILGVHLEGPYINGGKLGAQPDHARPVALDELAALHAIMPIRVITMAPEVPGNLECIARLSALGHVVQIGHTLGSYEAGIAALAEGARGFTHLFNAMSGLHHREPGMVGAALAHAQHAEIIPDLLHVHPGAVLAALRAIPGLYCVTDSTAATGMPDGPYRLGRHTVHKCLGGVRLADGTLAGSALTMDQALRNLVQVLGLDLQAASDRVSRHAAEYLGLTRRGRLVPGAWADLVVLDPQLEIEEVWLEGRRW